jgi:peptidoglycan glycosyltransferase
MDKQIRLIAIICAGLLVALMVSTTYTQFFNADNLAASQYNTRAVYEEYGKARGQINVNSGGSDSYQPTTIASSEPIEDYFKYQRKYVDSEIFSPITGFYSIANRSDRGIEQAMNDELNGDIPELTVTNFLDVVLGKENKGANINLTISESLQRFAMNELKNSGFKGAVVAIEPASGKILALASYPSIDYNDFTIHSTSKASKAYTDGANAPGDPMLNRATSQTYPPGSTFKIVTTAAVLETGKYTPETVIEAPLTYQLPGTSVNLPNYNGWSCNSDASGHQTLKTALAWSCNVPFAILGNTLGGKTIGEQASKFGFGSGTIIAGKTSEQGFNVAPSSFPSSDSPDRIAIASIGQGDTKMTPFQDCLLSAVVANDGKMMDPYLVANVTSADGTVIKETSPKTGEAVISSASAKFLNEMMVNNVSNGVANLSAVKGIKVAGKTGTAENDPALPSHSWFTGFAPADAPKIALSVFLENGDTEHGGAAVIASSIISKYLNGGGS